MRPYTLRGIERLLTRRLSPASPAMLGVRRVQVAQAPPGTQVRPGLFLFLRTDPELSATTQGLQRYEYPLQFPLNMMLILNFLDKVRDGSQIQFLPNEMLAAAFADVGAMEDHGVVVDLERRVLRVPTVNMSELLTGEISPEGAGPWGSVLAGYPIYNEKLASPWIFPVHLPDTVDEPTEDEVGRATLLGFGWNYANDRPDVVAEIKSWVKTALPQAKTIVTYNSGR